MQDSSRYAVGIDIGTTKVRCVVAVVDDSQGVPNIVGVGEASNTGMRKGTVVHLQGPAKAIDSALGQAERMSGYQVDEATLSINGAHILSTKTDGMIAIGAIDHEITPADIARLEDVATSGKVPANRHILELVPFSYRLDGQDGIKDPLGMTGTRLEINAHVVSALMPPYVNVQKAAENASVQPHNTVVSVVAAARTVLSEQQIENGVAVIDFGAATTGLAIFEEGDLQYTAVVPIGSNNITNDLAIGLRTDPEVAEQVKLLYASALPHPEPRTVTVKVGGDSHQFATTDIDEIVEARLDEIFEHLDEEFQKAGRKGKLPNGVVIVGGGANLRHLADYAKARLQLAVKKGEPKGFGGVAEQLADPAYAAAVGLMVIDSEGAPEGSAHVPSNKPTSSRLEGLKGFLNRFRT